MYRVYEFKVLDTVAEALEGHEYEDLESARVAVDLLQKKRFEADEHLAEGNWVEGGHDGVLVDYEEWLCENEDLSISNGGHAWIVDRDGLLVESDLVAEMLVALTV